MLQAKQEWEEQEAERQAAGGEISVAEPDEEQFVAYVALPDDKQIEQRVLEAKKANLLAKYTSEAIQKNQEEAKLLLNKQ